MRRLLLLLALSGAASVAVPAAQAAELGSKLPIVRIGTSKPVPNDPKIAARMRISDRGRRVYAGRAGIETRGHSSQLFPKKQYGIELRDRRGEGRDEALLGLPEDDDWVLSANYNDKTLMRNATALRGAGAQRQLPGRVRPDPANRPGRGPRRR